MRKSEILAIAKRRAERLADHTIDESTYAREMTDFAAAILASADFDRSTFIDDEIATMEVEPW